MKKHELLVPAGDIECLHQAVYNGCDAVYIAGTKFGARKYATNFTNEQLIEAIKFCHLYGVKVYITMNTLVKNREVDDFLEQVRFLYKNGVDAILVQDFGMICLLREKFPKLEIHASTQANNSSKESCELLYKLGVKRIVLSRELSLKEIEEIDVPIEKEVFIHGALCISYSGCCLMSSMLGGRSGNRGECAGSCRLPYTLTKDGKKISDEKYLLSTKELNTTDHIKELLNSNIYSFKIEGRMKSPLYVGFITRLYRRLIDGIELDLEEENNKLKTIFNREFTSGHLFNNTGKTIINDKSPNHIGLEIGTAAVYKDKIKIILNKNSIINQFDAIRFKNSNKGLIINYLYDENMKLCSSAKNICYVDNKIKLQDTDIVSKTQDKELEEIYNNIRHKKIPVSFKVEAKLGKELKITISDGLNIITETSQLVEKSINSPTTKESIKTHLSKLGNTPFEISEIKVNSDDDIFIQIKLLNNIRRNLIEKLINQRETKKIDFIEKEITFEKTQNSIKKEKKISCYVKNEEQLKTSLELKINRIYVNDLSLYKKYNYDNVYYAYDRCKYNYNDLVERSYMSDIIDYKNHSVIGNYSLNITNIYTAYYLKKIGLENIPLSVELEDNEIKEFITAYNEKFGYTEFEVLSYGRVENMIIKGNVLNIEKNIYNYELVDNKNRVFPVYFDGINTHIYNYEKINNKINGNTYTYYIDLYKETKEEIVNIVNKIRHE